MFKYSAKYCQKKKGFEKVPERHQDISEKESKSKSGNMVANDIEIFQRMKNKA